MARANDREPGNSLGVAAAAVVVGFGIGAALPRFFKQAFGNNGVSGRSRVQ